MKICNFTGECELKDNGTVPYCKAGFDCSYQKCNQTEVIVWLPNAEQSKNAMLRRKTKFIDNMDKFSSRKNAYKQGWKDCYEWIMSQSNER